MEFIGDVHITDNRIEENILDTLHEEEKDQSILRPSFTQSFKPELQQTDGPPPSNGPCSHESCLIASVRGLRNGLYYGGKVRFAHAIVMAILF